MTFRLSILLLPFLAAAQTTSEVRALEVASGLVSFTAETNFSAVTVHGKSDKIAGRVNLQQQGEQLLLDGIEARVEVASLSTGMGLRDQHMREKILKAADGTLPELRFSTDKVACPAPGSSPQVTCDLNGTFFLRGIGRPFRIALKLRSEGKAAGAYRVAGDGTLKLSDYAIEPPSQLGIRVANDVKVRIELTAKEQKESRASR